MNTENTAKANNKLTETLLRGITKPCDVCQNIQCKKRKADNNMQTKNESKTVEEYLELADRYLEEGNVEKARECLKMASQKNGETLKENEKSIQELYNKIFKHNLQSIISEDNSIIEDMLRRMDV